MKYHIEKNTVQETLVIPLFGRLVCSERFSELFSDPEAKRICDSLDYDFAEKRKKMESPAGLFGALEVAQRQYDLRCEVEAYLKEHPEAAVVNLGCGLDDTLSKADNGRCRGYNLDFADVIAVRNELLPAGERETNLACDLNDFTWMDRIDASQGAVFFAAGVFYYFKTEDVKRLFAAMAERFPGAVLAFDSCNERGAKLMRKTWLKEAGITDVSAFFSLEDEAELRTWSNRFASVTTKSYMRGYRDIYWNVRLFHKLMIRLLYKAFSYDGKRQMSKQIIEGIPGYVKLPEGGVGLDVGCGSGALTIACAKRNPQGRFIGIDHWGKEYASYNKPLCEANAKAEGVGNTEFRQGDALKLDFPDESFDAVVSNYVYHNILGRDRQEILLETLRVLKKGGTFALHDIFLKAKYGDMQAFVKNSAPWAISRSS